MNKILIAMIYGLFALVLGIAGYKITHIQQTAKIEALEMVCNPLLLRTK